VGLAFRFPSISISSHPERRPVQGFCEVILLALVVLAPWAYGSVEAWAELGLYAAIAALTFLGFVGLGCGRCWSRLCGPPSLALGALTLLACFQAAPLGTGISRWIAPAAAAARDDLLPAQPEHVKADDGPSVPFPAATLSLDPDSTLQMAARLAAAWLLFQAVWGLGGDHRARERFARLIIVNAVLLALFAIIQSLTWNGCIYWVRPVPAASPWSAGGPFVSHNHLAAYLNIGLGLALGSLLSASPREWLRRDSGRMATVYAAAIIAAGIVTCHSRSGFLGLLLAGLVLVVCSRKRPAAWVGLAVVLAAAGVYLAILAPASSFSARLATILDPGDDGYRSRLEVWRAAIRAWWEHPVWGSGLGSFPIAIIPYLSRDRLVFFARAENEYLDLLVEGGALGFLLGLAFGAAICWLAYQAIRRASGQWERDRGFAWGCVFGLIAVSVQSLADFAPHVPAIGVLAIALCGQLAALAQEGGSSEDLRPSRWGRSLSGIGIFATGRPGDRPSAQLRPPVAAPAPAPFPKPPGGLPRISRAGGTLAWLGSVALAVVLLAYGLRNAWVEKQLMSVSLPSPGAYLPTIGTNDGPDWYLEAWRVALQGALRLRPNWAEGHARLGLVHLGLYRLAATEWLLDSGTAVDDSELMANPLWLLGAVHKTLTAASSPTETAELLQFEPIGQHLIPAARAFLEARRCSPFWALPHSQLASLDYMLQGGDTASVYAERALSLAGSDGQIIGFLSTVALEVGDRDLAARCWRKAIVANPTLWPEVADAAAIVLSPTQILNDLAHDGWSAIEFADRIYSAPDQREIREKFLEVALDRLEHDRGLGDAERLFLQGEALAGLGRTVVARQRMETALSLQPGQSSWREKYVDWLLKWGHPDEAHAQAVLGLALSPDSAVLRAAVDRSAEALARGSPNG
jgi:O-antigen ligase/tetratricopeptide (TPR) repeat protein